MEIRCLNPQNQQRPNQPRQNKNPGQDRDINRERNPNQPREGGQGGRPGTQQPGQGREDDQHRQ